MRVQYRIAEIESALDLETLKFLAIGPSRSIAAISAALLEAGHTVTPVNDLSSATELFLEQPFNAVLVPDTLPSSEIAEFAAAIRQFETQTGMPRTPILSVVEHSGEPEPASITAETHAIAPANAVSGIDGVVPESIDPDSLTLAIARLASAVAVDSGVTAPLSLAPELPVLEIEELKAQVAYDTELLVELIDLYLSERVQQSGEMASALDQRDYPALARVAHTIKGSLGSLHAPAARVVAQSLELAAREADEEKCRDFLPALETQLDILGQQLIALKESVQNS